MHAVKGRLGYGRNSELGSFGASYGYSAGALVVAREKEIPASPIATRAGHIGLLIIFVVFVEVR
jgi:hypothetical protein